MNDREGETSIAAGARVEGPSGVCSGIWSGPEVLWGRCLRLPVTQPRPLPASFSLLRFTVVSTPSPRVHPTVESRESTEEEAGLCFCTAAAPKLLLSPLRFVCFELLLMVVPATQWLPPSNLPSHTLGQHFQASPALCRAGERLVMSRDWKETGVNV